MRKITLFILFAFSSFLYGGNVNIFDFETSFVGKWGTNGNPTNNATNEDHVNFFITNNPNQTGINTSSKVGEFNRLKTGLWWAYAWFEFTPITVSASLNSPKYLHISIYKPLSSTVCIQLKNAVTGVTVTTGEITSNKQTKINDWQDIVFKITTSGTFGYIEVKPDFVNATVSSRLSADTPIYFDNIYLSDDPTPTGDPTIPPYLGSLPETFEGTSTLLDPIDYCGDRYGSFIQTFATTDLVVVENPFKDRNTTNKCGKFVRKQSGPWNAGFFVIPTAPMVINATNKYFHIMIYKTMQSPLNLKLESGSPVSTTGDITINPTASDVNKWVDYVFEIPAAKYSSYAKISLFPDFLQSPVPSDRFTEDQNIYFDDIEINDSPNTRDITTNLKNPNDLSANVWIDNNKDIIIIKYSNLEDQARLYDMAGHNIKTIILSKGKNIIKANELKSGVYLVKIEHKSYKIIIN